MEDTPSLPFFNPFATRFLPPLRLSPEPSSPSPPPIKYESQANDPVQKIEPDFDNLTLEDDDAIIECEPPLEAFRGVKGRDPFLDLLPRLAKSK